MAKLIILVLSLFWGLSLAAPEERIVNTRDVAEMLRSKLKSPDAPFASSRHPVHGIAGRKAMIQYIKHQVEMLELKARQRGLVSLTEIYTNTTRIYYNGDTKDINVTNILLVLNPNLNDTIEDTPLMLLTNHDTDTNGNFVNDGSGIAALLVLADLLINDLDSSSSPPRSVLKRSIVFAFTDAAFKRNHDQHVAGAETGATQIAKYWLPKFLADRKSFNGAIVLDNIMNFNDTVRSQIVQGLGIDRSFPEAYAQISEKEFVGDFLGLLQRDNSVDHPIVLQVQEGWRTAGYETKQGEVIEPRLIPFKFGGDIFVSTSVNHFLNSEQSAFWNHPIDRAGILPAVTLTDTRTYRTTDCRNMCSVEAMATEKNLAFMKHTVNTLRRVVIKMQTDNAAMPRSSGSFAFLAVLALIILAIH